MENGNGSPDSGGEVVPETYVHDLAVVALRLEAHERLIQHAVDNTLVLLKRTDPLTWVRRAVILGACSTVGSALGAAIVHTIWLAYFRR